MSQRSAVRCAVADMAGDITVPRIERHLPSIPKTRVQQVVNEMVTAGELERTGSQRIRLMRSNGRPQQIEHAVYRFVA